MNPASPPDPFERRVISKIFWRLIPFLGLCFVIAFLDRNNVSFAKLRMNADLGFSDKIYGMGAGIFFIGYFLFEVPSNLVLERVGARIWIARIMVFWGIIASCMMFVKSTTSFYALRFLLGAGEAGFFPGVILYLTYWFPSAYRSRTIAFFMMAAALSSAFGAPLSGYLMDSMGGVAGLASWKWLFLVEGIPAVILGIAVFCYLPDRPEKARWLAADEIQWLQSRLAKDVSGPRVHLSLFRGLTQGRVLLLGLIYLLFVTAAYGLSMFLPSIIEGFGGKKLTMFQTGLLSALPPLTGAIAMVLNGRHSDRTGERHFHIIVPVLLQAAGLVLAATSKNPVAALAGMCMAEAGRWSCLAPFWAMSTGFLSGTTVAAGGIALINSVGNLGGHFGPDLMGRLKLSTGGYAAGLGVLAASLVLGCILVVALKVVSPRRGINC